MTWEQQKSGSRGKAQIFRTRIRCYPAAGRQTDDVGSFAVTLGKLRPADNLCVRQPLSRKKLNGSVLKASGVFLSGFLSSKPRSWEEGHDGSESPLWR